MLGNWASVLQSIWRPYVCVVSSSAVADIMVIETTSGPCTHGSVRVQNTLSVPAAFLMGVDVLL